MKINFRLSYYDAILKLCRFFYVVDNLDKDMKQWDYDQMLNVMQARA